MEKEIIKEKKSKKWIFAIILILLIMIGSFFCGFFLYKSKVFNIFNFGNKNNTNENSDGYIDIWYGKRIVIEYDSHKVVTGVMGGLVGNDDAFNQEIEKVVVDNDIQYALGDLARTLYTKKIITDSNNVLFVHTYNEKDAKKLIKVLEDAFVDRGLKSVNIIHYEYDEMTKEAKEYAQLHDVNLSRVNYISLIAKQNNKTIDDYVNKTNKELFVLYSDSGNTSTNTTTNTNTTNTNSTTSSKCNSGYVFVSDENKCFNSHKTASIIKNNCGANQFSDSNSCYDIVSSDNCNSGDDRYVMMSGNCVDNYSVSERGWNCPSGYTNIWGNYGGQTFNGDCYHYENPNY